MSKKSKISQIQMAQILRDMSKAPFGSNPGGAKKPINLDVQGLEKKSTAVSSTGPGQITKELYEKKFNQEIKRVAKNNNISLPEARDIVLKNWKGQEPPTFISQEQYNKIAKSVAKEKGISFGKAKELLWKELRQAPEFKPPIRPVVSLASKIPLRQDLETTGLRAVKYKGEVIYLTPGQIKGVAQNLGVKIEKVGPLIDVRGGAVASGWLEETYLTKAEQQALLNEKMKKAQEKAIEERYKSEAQRRVTADIAAEREATRLRREALNDWQNQARASQTDSRVRPPLEGFITRQDESGKTALIRQKPSPASDRAAEYAERLFQKSLTELDKKERAKIKEIIRIENDLARKAEASVLGRKMDEMKIERGQYTPKTNNLKPATGGAAVGGIGNMPGQGFGGGLINPVT